MGLDLVVEACAKPGHEAEWRRLMERAFQSEESTQAEIDHFREISIPPFERVGAPRVGFDNAADDWIVVARNATTSEEIASVLNEFHGHYVLQLAKCDGVPIFSHGGLYEGVDETSFRGAFLSDCHDVLAGNLIEEAWAHKFPDEAVSYGVALLAAVNSTAADAGSKHARRKPGLLSRLGLAKKAPESMPLEEQLEIVQAAGKWFIYWGERGHAIRAWF